MKAELHCNRGTPHAAFNVKYYKRLPEPSDALGYLTEAVRENAYKVAQEIFWEDAIDIVEQAGFQTAYSEGRSGGWVAPHPYTDLDDSRLADIGDALDELTKETVTLYSELLQNALWYKLNYEAGLAGAVC